MTVKRYTPTQCCERDGTYVTYSDYQKLVAENAALNGAIERVSGVYKLSPHIQKLCEIKTPNTDAAIAEIGAKAVEQAAEFAPWLYGSQLGVQVEAVPREELFKFAANLRAGRKG